MASGHRRPALCSCDRRTTLPPKTSPRKPAPSSTHHQTGSAPRGDVAGAVAVSKKSYLPRVICPSTATTAYETTYPPTSCAGDTCWETPSPVTDGVPRARFTPDGLTIATFVRGSGTDGLRKRNWTWVGGRPTRSPGAGSAETSDEGCAPADNGNIAATNAADMPSTTRTAAPARRADEHLQPRRAMPPPKHPTHPCVHDDVVVPGDADLGTTSAALAAPEPAQQSFSGAVMPNSVVRRPRGVARNRLTLPPCRARSRCAGATQA